MSKVGSSSGAGSGGGWRRVVVGEDGGVFRKFVWDAGDGLRARDRPVLLVESCKGRSTCVGERCWRPLVCHGLSSVVGKGEVGPIGGRVRCSESSRDSRSIRTTEGKSSESDWVGGKT